MLDADQSAAHHPGRHGRRGVLVAAGQRGVAARSARRRVRRGAGPRARPSPAGRRRRHVRRALLAFPNRRWPIAPSTRFFREGGRPEGTPTRRSPHLTVDAAPRHAWSSSSSAASSRCGWPRRATTAWSASTASRRSSCSTPGTLLGAHDRRRRRRPDGRRHPPRDPPPLDTLAARRDRPLPDRRRRRRRGRVHPRRRPARDLVGPALPPLHAAGRSWPSSRPTCSRRSSPATRTIRPDGFVVEAPPAGGHNAPPRKVVIDDSGEMIFGPRDEPDLGQDRRHRPAVLAGRCGRHAGRAARGSGRRAPRASRSARTSPCARTPASTTAIRRQLVARHPSTARCT